MNEKENPCIILEKTKKGYPTRKEFHISTKTIAIIISTQIRI